MSNRVIENKKGRREKIKEEEKQAKEDKKRLKEEKKAEKAEKKKNKKGIGKKILLVLAIIFVIFASIFVFKLAKNNWDFGKTLTQDVLGPKDPVYVLAMGVSEDLEVPLTDTMMVIGYNPNDQKAFAISIPRDTFIGSNKETAGGYDKLNSLYQKSPEKTKAAIEKILGIDIDYYVVVQNKVVRDVVDALGAVEFNVPIDMNYDDKTQDLHIHLKAGIQSMNGEQVEQLLRFRHNNDGSTYPVEYGIEDYGRMRTQREFVKELLKQCIRFQNVTKIIDLATAFFDNVDTDMSLATMVSYVPYALQYNPDDLLSEQVPGASAMLNSLSFYEYYPKQTKTIVADLLDKIGLEDEAEEYRVEYKLKSKKVTNTTENKVNNTVKNETKNTVKNEVKNEVKKETKNTTNTSKSSKK